MKMLRKPLKRNPVSMAIADGIGQMEVREIARQQIVVQDKVLSEIIGASVDAEAAQNAPDAMGKPL